MMRTLTDVHQMFAEFFPEKAIRPYAYLLSKRLGEGHVCIPLSEPTEMAAELPGDLIKDLSDPAKLHLLDRLVGQPGSVVPFILDDDRLYLQRYHAYETRIVELVRKKVDKGQASVGERMAALEAQRDLIRSLMATYPTIGLREEERIDWQLIAALNALLADFSIITGGPGTGKTTTLAKLLRILYAMQPDAKIALAAPTGKAAMRMLESLKRSASDFPEDVKQKIEKLKPYTLHRLLGYQHHQVTFKYNAENPLPLDFVIVDEASMVDMPMFSKLLEAMGEQGRLVLLGDKDQLASVEAGSLLGDLCQSVDKGQLNGFSDGLSDWLNDFISDPDRRITDTYRRTTDGVLAERIVELKLSHRFKALGDIGLLSRAIIGGDTDAVGKMMDANTSTTVRFDSGDDDKILEAFVAGYEHFIKEPDPAMALQRLNDLRVLVTVREGPRGLYQINRRIEELLQARKLIRTGRDFYDHRPVIVTRNNYELGLFNGDIGITRKEGNKHRVYFENESGEMRPILSAYLSHCETVYAMTIHKSQGSEFSRVLVILPDDRKNPILTRELLYTGVTRAKESVIVRGSRETVLHTVAQQVRRISGITGRMARS
jgi:exodeoxyribonuclease V alpha subunit